MYNREGNKFLGWHMSKTYNFPVFATQGGGLVREASRNPYRYVFVEAPPEGMGLGVGDFMPEEWDLIPANRQAREVIDEEQFGHSIAPTFSAIADMSLGRRP